MRISNCLHPKLIYNKYTHEKQYVPCGNCEACCNIKSYNWQQRIVQESRLHRYSIFFTLTYDDECIPMFTKLSNGDLVEIPRSQFKLYKGSIKKDLEFSGLYIDNKDLDLSEYKDLCYYNNYSTFPYASVSDCQKFIKRLRSNIYEFFKKVQESNVSQQKEKFEDYKIRYVLVSEYGPSSFRPHYHGLLWFESRTLAKEIDGFIRKSWLNCSSDNIDVKCSNASIAPYVAKYINSLVHLPTLYRHHYLRPFLLCSRRPFISNGLYSREKVQEILDKSTVLVRQYDVKKQTYVACRHSRSFENKFFPKCLRFGVLSPSDRISLYTIYSRKNFPKKNAFIADILVSECSDSRLIWKIFYDTYYDISNLTLDAYEKIKNDYLVRIWLLSKHIHDLAVEYGYSDYEYVNRIFAYWNAVDRYNLNQMYSFQSDYAKEHDPSDLSCMYPLGVLDFQDVLIESHDYKEMESVHKKIHNDMENNKKRKSFLRQSKMKKQNIRYYV